MITKQMVKYFRTRPPKLKRGQWVNRNDNAAARGGCRHRTLYWSAAEQAPPVLNLDGKYHGRVQLKKLAIALIDSRGGLASEYKSDSWAKDEKRIRF